MKSQIINPIIAEVFRGKVVESRHRGSFAVADQNGRIVAGAGAFNEEFFPRSAIKAIQCLPVIESGAAAHFGLNDEEIALCCSSHRGEADHVRVARSILSKARIDEACYECGAHMPADMKASYELIRHDARPGQVHNVCSGKHAGMLALAKHLGAPLNGYVRPDHPVQRAVLAALERLCQVDLSHAPLGTDGCSAPTWALPMSALAQGFARLAIPENESAQWILRAVRNYPAMIEGEGRFDTRIMQAVPRLFIKFGAEGVFCGVIAHAGLGFTLKCDDGAARGAQVAVAQMLATLNVWDRSEREALQMFAREHLVNWRKLDVGDVVAAVLE